MTTIAKEQTREQSEARPAWLVGVVGTTVGLLIMGDSLLYNILPLAAGELGLTLPMVGVLLSANRLVRLASNVWSSTLFERLGPRRPFVGATVMGAASTALYGAGLGFLFFAAARMLWGVSWSGLRQAGYQAVWTGHNAIKGRLTGLLWGLVRLGSAIGVLAGGYLFDRLGYRTTVWIFAAIALLAIPLALTIRWPHGGRPTQARAEAPEQTSSGMSWLRRWSMAWGTAMSDPVRRWLAAASFVEYLLSGVVVSTTSVYLNQRLGGEATVWGIVLGVGTLAGMLQGVRWLTDLALGPAMGALSDRLGQATAAFVLGGTMFAGLAGVVGLPVVAAIPCLLLVMLCDGGLHIVMSAAASGAAQASPRPHMFVGIFTTMSDAGSALGPLIAYSLVAFLSLPLLYLVFGAALWLCLAVVWHYRTGLT